MKPAPTVSVVVTNFNGERYLPKMMAALAATGYPFHEIIVSDDASTDGGRLWLRCHHPEVRLITSAKNRGPAPTRNAGIFAATGTYVLLLDNDGHPYPDAIPPLVRALEADPELVAVMPRVILASDGHDVVHYDGARTHLTGQMWLVNSHADPETVGCESVPLASMVGTAMFFRREAAVAIGGFEPAYYFYYEDHDFGTRMRLLCGPIRSCPESRIRHLGGTADLSFRVGARYPRRRIYLTPKNRWLFTLRTLEGRTLRWLLPILILHELAQFGFVLVKGWAEPVFLAWTWNLRHLGRTLRQREQIAARRIVPDAAILQDGPLPLHPGLLAGKPWARRLIRGLDGFFSRWYRLVRPQLARSDGRFAGRVPAHRAERRG